MTDRVYRARCAGTDPTRDAEHPSPRHHQVVSR